jgi:hypothetical protein
LESQGSLFLSSGKTVCTDHFIAVEVYLTTHLPGQHEALQGSGGRETIYENWEKVKSYIGVHQLLNKLYRDVTIG